MPPLPPILIIMAVAWLVGWVLLWRVPHLPRTRRENAGTEPLTIVIPARNEASSLPNLLGDLWSDGEPDWTTLLGRPDIHLHLYGKGEARPGRKMGHLTCVGDDAGEALRQVLDAREALTGR